MKLSDLGKRLIVAISIIAFLFIIGSAIYYRSLYFLPFMIGVILGTAVSIAKVFFLERTVDKALAMEQKDAKNYISLHHVLRLIFTGVVLVLSAIVPQINLWGAVVGVLAFQFAIYSVKFMSKS